jgi:hypothetical protein
MIRMTLACAVALAAVFAGATSKAQEGGPPVVYEEDCGKTAIILCDRSGQRMAGAPRWTHVVHFRRYRHVHYCTDQPACDLNWLWNDP